MDKQIKLTVCVSTYNQKSFIGDCLESLLSQETDFPWNIVVSDDCSTDGTLEVVRAFEKKSQGRIRIVTHDKNQGPFLNYVAVHSQADGELVAHMDGDDVAYPGKLKTQVNYMDSNLDCSICWHRMFFFNEHIKKEHPLINSYFTNRKIYADELCYLGPFAPHSSTMYRRCNFNIDMFREKCDDWLVSVFYIGKGYGLMLNDALGGYRINSNSMSSGSVATKKNRELSTGSQIIAIKEYPHLAPDVATRALANFLLDSVKLRSYCWLSLKVLICARSLPKISKAIEILRFYRWSKLPESFKG